jgi:hypothetical protein
MNAEEVALEIFRRKKAAHRAAAKLSIEEKLFALVRMQKQANEIRRSTGRPEIIVWTLD